MLLEFLSHAAALDLAWIASLILGNLHWVFAIMAFTIIAEGSKRSVWHFLVLMGFLYAFLDVMELGGWILAPLILMVPIQLFVGLYFPKGSWPERNFVKIVTVLFFALSFIHTFYFTLPGG